MTDLLIAPTDPEVDEDWTLEHIVSEQDPDTALCGADMTDCDVADGSGDLCVVCAEIGGELEL